MLAYVVQRPGQTALAEIEKPRIGPYEALVRIELCVICNSTDKMIVDGKFPYPISYPCVLGHESVGTVVEVGEKVTAFRVGDRVTRAGFRPEPGDDRLHTAWGGYAEYGIAEDMLALQTEGLPHGYINQAPLVIPPEITLREAALFISLGETASFTSQLGDIQGKSLVVIGTGIAGLAVAFFSKKWGASKVTVVGRREERLALARSLGADQTINITAEVQVETETADILIEASGSPTSLKGMLRCLKPNGQLAVYGVNETGYDLPLFEGPGDFRISRISPHETTMMPRLADMFRKGEIPTDLFLTHEWDFADIERAFEETKSGDVVKGIVWISK